MPVWVRGGRLQMAQRALAYGIAGVGLITTLTAMAALHPHEQVYFNALTDTETPGALAERYDMDYWFVAERQLLEGLLARYPDDTLRARPGWQNLPIFPQNDRERVITLGGNPHLPDFHMFGNFSDSEKKWLRNKNRQFYIHPRIDLMDILDQPLLHSVRAYGSIRAYGSLVASIVAKDVEAYQAAYDDVAANGDPLARSDFDIYDYDGALYYLNASCPPPAPNRDALWIFLHITPADLADLPAARRELSFENRDFRIRDRAAFFDGKCIHRQPLPEYPIARIDTGVYLKGELIWRADINLAARAAAQSIYDGIAAGDYGAPVAQSGFDLYLRDNALTYLKAPCVFGDADARFFLHIFPADSADLPAVWREYGFVNLDFQFTDYGAYAGDICVAERELPAYPIDRIRTGQFVSGEGAIWRAEFAAER